VLGAEPVVNPLGRILEAIPDGRQPCALAPPALLEAVPILWDEQRSSMAESATAPR
jgi:hypothetical protein